MIVYALALALFLKLSPISVQSRAQLHGRDLNQPLLESYDYIVVGCGISGLVLTNRLSELVDRSVNNLFSCYSRTCIASITSIFMESVLRCFVVTLTIADIDLE